MSAIDRFKDLLDERGWTYAPVYRESGLKIDPQVELQVFGQRMVVTKANPINDPTHTRLVAHILCPTPEELMMMLGRMCGKTGYKTGPDAHIQAQLFCPDTDLSPYRDWSYQRYAYSCGHVVTCEGPSSMELPVCPICGGAEGRE